MHRDFVNFLLSWKDFAGGSALAKALFNHQRAIWSVKTSTAAH
jgi:hypothetical protein